MKDVATKFFEYLKRLSFPVLLLVACTVCIQMHASVYWDQVMGEGGLLISLTLEGVAILFWVYSKVDKGNKGVWFVAVLATVLSVSAPALKNLGPLMDEYKEVTQKIDVWDLELSLIESSMEVAKSEFENNSENSTKYRGWLEATAEARKNYNAEKNAYTAHLNDKPSYLDILQNNLKVFTVLVMVLVLQMASVMLSRIIGGVISQLSQSSIGSSDDLGQDTDRGGDDAVDLTNGPKLSVVSNNHANYEDLSSYISVEVKKYLEANSEITSAILAKKSNVDARDISLLINHEEKLKLKKSGNKIRVVSEAKAKQVAKACGITLPESIRLTG